VQDVLPGRQSFTAVGNTFPTRFS